PDPALRRDRVPAGHLPVLPLLPPDPCPRGGPAGPALGGPGASEPLRPAPADRPLDLSHLALRLRHGRPGLPHAPPVLLIPGPAGFCEARRAAGPAAGPGDPPQ